MARLADLDAQGFSLVQAVLSPDLLDRLIAALSPIDASSVARTRDSDVYGARHIFRTCPEVARVVARSPLVALARDVLGPDARPVRTLLFSKPSSANWKVGWHQDLTIAVSQRAALPGFGPWSMKAGVVHVQPPVEILERSIALRIHLDDCAESDGPLRVLPGSHGRGRLDRETTASLVTHGREVVCTAARGDVLLMRPLLLHRSLPTSGTSPRRVLHLEYSAATLPSPLSWLESP